MNKKYLIYKNIVRGAGLGHAMVCYNYGLNLSMQQDQVFIPSPLILNHGFNKSDEGLAEASLGLPFFGEAFADKLLKNQDYATEHVEYLPKNPALANFDATKAYFVNRYKNRLQLIKGGLETKKSIAISIRRGDLLSNIKKFKNRLIPCEFYINAISFILKNISQDVNYINVFTDGGINENFGFYVDEQGNRKDICKIISSKFGLSCKVHVGTSSIDCLCAMQACVESDFFVCSNSGFSRFITLYRDDKLSLIKGGSSKFRSLGNKFLYI